MYLYAIGDIMFEDLVVSIAYFVIALHYLHLAIG